MDGITSAPIHEFYQDVYYVDSDNNFKRRRLVNGAIVDEPLIEGVDDFQLQYGIDTDADNIADTFTTTPCTHQLFWLAKCENGYGIFVNQWGGSQST